MKTWGASELGFFLELAQDDDLYPAWHLDAHTGLRRGELLGLQWPDLDLDAGQLAVRRTLVSVNYEIRFEEPKTPRARRTVALDAVTVKILKSIARTSWSGASRQTPTTATTTSCSVRMTAPLSTRR